MPEAPILSITGLRHMVDGRVVLDIPKASFPGTGISVILGPNGAGKSVFLRLVHGILPVQAGHINYAESAPRQAMVFQRPVLLRRSVAANISFALKASHGDPSKLADLLKLAGLTGQANQPARSLSGGEQQRLAMARALATSPDILFLDEPTANLDPGATLKLEDLILQAAAQGTKIIMVTHNLGQAKRLAGDLSVLDQGQIIEAGPAEMVFATPRTQQTAEFLRQM